MEHITYLNGMWYITRRVRGSRYATLFVGIRQSGTTDDSQFAYRRYDVTGR